MKKITTLMSGAAAICLLASSQVGATTIFSEDFSSGFGAFTPFGAAEITTGAPGYVNCCGATGSAANLANPFVALGSGQRSFSGLSAQIDIVAGQKYQLSFDYASLGAGTDRFDVGQMVDSSGIVVIASRPISGTANNNFDTTFTRYVIDFMGFNTGTATFSFAQRSSGDGIDTALDNFVIASPDAVPEPTTWAMMITGFGAIGAAMRRRKVAVSFA